MDDGSHPHTTVLTVHLELYIAHVKSSKPEFSLSLSPNIKTLFSIFHFFLSHQPHLKFQYHCSLLADLGAMEVERLCISGSVDSGRVLCSLVEFVVVETTMIAHKSVVWLLLLVGSIPNDIDLLQKGPIADERFPITDLKKMKKPETENKDANEDEDDDKDEDDDDEEEEDDDDDDDADEDDTDSEDSDDDVEANGDGGSDDDEDEDDDGEEDDDEDEEDDDEDDDEEEEEKQAQPPPRKK